MKVSISWLKEYINTNTDAQTLADKLTMAGLEVDSVTDRFEYLNSVKVGKILEIQPHPNADKLRLCKVSIGDDELSVVCGADNIKEGHMVPAAMPGTCFPDGSVLKVGSIRGEKSQAMLCSEKELGLGEDDAGIMILENSLEPGSALNTALDISDMVLEIDLTPNRPDCTSIIGVAREIAANEGIELTIPAVEIKESGEPIDNQTSVTIKDPDHCQRYAARLITNVNIAPSPFWLQDRLLSVGLRPINNIVDITNFVMMETGQPLHAFDFNRLEENRIVVKLASNGEKFTTLDKQERELKDHMLMICDAKQPVGVAGVMGGLFSEVENDTTAILLESAYFRPTSIRKTAKKLGLATDASFRLERGVDPEGTVNALNRASQLMAELSGGVIAKGYIDEHPKPVIRPEIHLSVKRTHDILGINPDADKITKILKSIEFNVTSIDENNLLVVPPSYRVDVQRPEDLMEEVARLIGYDNIPTTAPIGAVDALKPLSVLENSQKIKQILIGLGYNEVVNYSFIHEASPDRLTLNDDDYRRKCVKLLNPLNEEQAVLRTCLIPGLLETMERNNRRQNKDLRIFEMGKIFIDNDQDDLPNEINYLGLLLTGRRSDSSWHTKTQKCDFYDLKGVLEGLFQMLQVKSSYIRINPKNFPYYRPGYSAEIIIDGKSIGVLGEVYPDVLKNYGLKQTAYICEINLDTLIPKMPQEKNFKDLPKFPSTSRDLTLILNSEIEVQTVFDSIMKYSKDLVESVTLLDVYEGKPIEEGKKSVSFRITFRSWKKTLKDSFVNKMHKDIADLVIKEFGAGLP